jgi:hypothetical protein
MRILLVVLLGMTKLEKQEKLEIDQRTMERQHAMALHKVRTQLSFDPSYAAFLDPGVRGRDLAHCYAVIGVLSVGVRMGAEVSGHSSSGASALARRNRIRETYKTLPNVGRTMCVVFVLGLEKPDAVLTEAQVAEARMHRDLVWVRAPDSITGFKAYAWFRAAAHELTGSALRFIGKADEDEYVQTQQLEDDLRKMRVPPDEDPAMRPYGPGGFAILGHFMVHPGVRFKGNSTRASRLCLGYGNFVDSVGPGVACERAHRAAGRVSGCHQTPTRAALGPLVFGYGPMVVYSAPLVRFVGKNAEILEQVRQQRGVQSEVTDWMEDVYWAHLVHMLARKEAVSITLGEVTGGKLITWKGGRGRASENLRLKDSTLAQNVTDCSYLVHGMKSLERETWEEVHGVLGGQAESCFPPIEMIWHPERNWVDFADGHAINVHQHYQKQSQWRFSHWGRGCYRRPPSPEAGGKPDYVCPPEIESRGV